MSKNSNKFLIIAESILVKISIENIVKYSQYDSWFIHEISEIDFENILLKNFNEEILLKAKKHWIF